MTDAEQLRAEIKQLYDRRDLVEDCWKADLASVENLIAQKVGWDLIEEHRDKATAYFESYLDLTILIGRLTRKLEDPTKT